MSMMSNFPWINLSSDWEQIEKVASHRQKTKEGFKSTTFFNQKQSHLVGLAGEFIYAKMTGLEVNLSNYQYEGDGKLDFPNVDVKTSTFFTEPYLRLSDKEYCYSKSYYFILIALNLPNKKGKYMGYQTWDYIGDQPMSQLNGKPLYVIKPDQLIRELPPTAHSLESEDNRQAEL